MTTAPQSQMSAAQASVAYWESLADHIIRLEGHDPKQFEGLVGLDRYFAVLKTRVPTSDGNEYRAFVKGAAMKLVV